MKSIGYGSLALALALVAFAHVAAAQVAREDERDMPGYGDRGYEKLRLVVGEQKVLSAEGVRSFSEGTRGVVEIRLTKDNDRFVVVGLRPGKTTVLFLMLDGSEVHYDIRVDAAETPLKDQPEGLQARDNIRLDFYFVQLSQSGGSSVGIAWPTSLSATATLNMRMDFNSGATGASAVISAQALPRLDFAQASGWAKVLRKAAVITANETPATFSSGGEVNIVVNGGFGGNLKQVRYGSEISVRPRYDKRTGRIELQFTADVSDLTPENGTGVPGRTVSTLETVVNLELGQSLVLAGLTSASEAKSRAGLIGLSQIPILGALFGTHSNQTTENEVAIFIVPSVMDTVTLQQRALISEALTSYHKFSGNMDAVAPLMLESRPR